MINHPITKFGLAIVLSKTNKKLIEEITSQDLINELINCKNHFRTKVVSIDLTFKVKYDFQDEKEPNTKNGVYLSPYILSDDKGAKNVYKAIESIIIELNTKDLETNIELTRSIITVAGEFTGYGGKTITRGKPKTTLRNAALSLIATTSPIKPCMSFKTVSKSKTEFENRGIFPDLEIDKLINFIRLYEKILQTKTENLKTGSYLPERQIYFRPKIYDGNFPNAPSLNSFGSVALLASIGTFVKEAEIIDWGKEVLESLKEQSVYAIGHKTFDTFQYNTYIIDLAKSTKLSTVIDSLYYVKLYKEDYRNSSNKIEYQKFDLFTSRFLLFFNHTTFKDFFAFRAEYPHQLSILITYYFNKMNKINKEIVESSKLLGKWLNLAAYIASDKSIDKDANERTKKVREQKAKYLVEIESSIFSARDGDSLIFQAITRAGRASGLDAPAGAELIMKEVISGDLNLDSAKHMIIAFSRLRNKVEPKDEIEDTVEDAADESPDDLEIDDDATN